MVRRSIGGRDSREVVRTASRRVHCQRLSVARGQAVVDRAPGWKHTAIRVAPCGANQRRYAAGANLVGAEGLTFCGLAAADVTALAL